MISKDDQVRAAIADQAGEWFVANDAEPLNAQDSAALADWLKTSPVHIEEFLGVSVVSRDLRELGKDSEFSLDAILASVRAETDTPVGTLWPRVFARPRSILSRRWLTAAVAMAALALFSVGLFWSWNKGLWAPVPVSADSAAQHYETRHGEQRTVRLADDSVLHLNTDSAVSIRYGKTERFVLLTRGEAEFEVVHDPNRAFRVSAGSTEVVAIGTMFDVRLEPGSTVVIVVGGRVIVGQSPMSGKPGTRPSEELMPVTLQLGANQQIRVTEGAWDPVPMAIDAQHATAWLRRQIVFDQEPLERVAAEFSRYSPKPIEIVTLTLRDLQISGVFSTDDTAAFIAFLRSLKGVRVEVSATRIRVSQKAAVAPPDNT
jgi:transmembrane sensor